MEYLGWFFSDRCSIRSLQLWTSTWIHIVCHLHPMAGHVPRVQVELGSCLIDETSGYLKHDVIWWLMKWPITVANDCFMVNMCFFVAFLREPNWLQKRTTFGHFFSPSLTSFQSVPPAKFVWAAVWRSESAHLAMVFLAGKTFSCGCPCVLVCQAFVSPNSLATWMVWTPNASSWLRLWAAAVVRRWIQSVSPSCQAAWGTRRDFDANKNKQTN